MGLFGSLVNLAFGGPPGIKTPPRRDLAAEAETALSSSLALQPKAQKLAAGEAEFLRGQIGETLNTAVPWLQPFQQSLANNLLSFQRGEVPQDVSDYVLRRTGAKAFGGGFGYAPARSNLEARDLGLTSLDLINQSSNTAANWVNLMSRIYAPANVDFAGQYMITPGQQAQFDVSQDATQTYYKNLKRQFEYATDPMRGVEQGVAGLADTVGTALSVYLGGLGGGAAGGGGGAGVGGMFSGLLGMGSGGGTPSTMQFLQGIYQPPTAGAWGMDEGGVWSRPWTGGGWFGNRGPTTYQTY